MNPLAHPDGPGQTLKSFAIRGRLSLLLTERPGE